MYYIERDCKIFPCVASSANNNGNNDIDVATDEEILEMLVDVFGKSDDSSNIATDDEISEMLNDVTA